MKDCYILICNSYDSGLDAYAFYDMESAHRAMVEDAAMAAQNLSDRGYDPVVKEDYDDSRSVFDRDNEEIFYDWEIIESTIS